MPGDNEHIDFEQTNTRLSNGWLINVLEELKAGKISVDNAVEKLKTLPYEDMDWAKVDHHRSVRTGFPEVIFGRGKTPEQITAISEKLLEKSTRLLVTRANKQAAEAVKVKISDAVYNELSGTIVVNREPFKKRVKGVSVVSAGTADLPIAEEAVVTAELMGNEVEKIIDIGVAGIHRLFDKLSLLRKSRVIVVVAGMEGALPSVIAGLVSVPVIAVPTSVGYGASFGGIAPLLTMLNSCAPGITVVNIDNGFGAGYTAGLINLMGGDS